MDKLKKMQRSMPPGMEAALIRDSANRFYLTGMKSSAGSILVTRDRAWLIIDFRYVEEAQKKVKNCLVIEEKQWYNQVKDLLSDCKINCLSLNGACTSLAEYRQAEENMQGIRLDASDALASWSVKTDSKT